MNRQMNRCSRRNALCWIAAGLLAATAPVRAQNATDAAADYKARLAQYLEVHGAYQAEADAYWNAVAGKRRTRNAKRRNHEPIAHNAYVLAQPPV
jgi:hypothetical protein